MHLHTDYFLRKLWISDFAQDYGKLCTLNMVHYFVWYIKCRFVQVGKIIVNVPKSYMIKPCNLVHTVVEPTRLNGNNQFLAHVRTICTGQICKRGQNWRSNPSLESMWEHRDCLGVMCAVVCTNGK